MANNLNTNPSPTSGPARKCILIVDDDANIRSLLREILRAQPYELLEAADGREALDMIHQNTVDLLITDRTMPRMDGLQLMKTLQKENRKIPVLVISAYGDEDVWAEAIGLGAEDYILKPFSTESVMRIVKRKLP